MAQWFSSLPQTIWSLLSKSSNVEGFTLASKYSPRPTTPFLPRASSSVIFFYTFPPAQFEISELVKKEDNKKKSFLFFLLLLRKGYHQKRFTKRKNSECLIIQQQVELVLMLFFFVFFFFFISLSSSLPFYLIATIYTITMYGTVRILLAGAGWVTRYNSERPNDRPRSLLFFCLKLPLASSSSANSATAPAESHSIAHGSLKRNKPAGSGNKYHHASFFALLFFFFFFFAPFCARSHAHNTAESW